MRKRIYIIALLAIVSSVVSSCGHNEDAEAGPLEQDQWLYPYGASSADKQLQENFYKTNGIYLLFNDTLQKKQTSINPDGSPFYEYEAVRLDYSVSGEGDGSKKVFAFDYLNTDTEKQTAADFVQNKVLPHLSGSLMPFSVLLVNRIDYTHSGSDTYYQMATTHPVVYAGPRCTAIAVAGIDDMSDAEQTSYCNNILMNIINSKLSSLPEGTFDEFYSFCSAYYGTYGMNDDAMTLLATYPTQYDLGLLENGCYAYTDGTNPAYPSFSFPMYNIKAKEYDLQDYTEHLFSMTEEEFTAKYGKYPVVIKKYRILKKIYEDLGVKF